jgi:hypothetical protein
MRYELHHAAGGPFSPVSASGQEAIMRWRFAWACSLADSEVCPHRRTDPNIVVY